MTEKRFKLAYKEDDWWAVRDGEITLWKEEVVHLLNELHEENRQLRDNCKNSLIKAGYFLIKSLKTQNDSETI